MKSEGRLRGVLVLWGGSGGGYEGSELLDF